LLILVLIRSHAEFELGLSVVSSGFDGAIRVQQASCRDRRRRVHLVAATGFFTCDCGDFRQGRDERLSDS
jgi:hypothetical protein